jgi:hypothetical protein
MPASHLKERTGLLLVEQRIVEELRWIFRNQPVSDFGIDAHLEVVQHESATGRLVAMQIKSGPSYFREETEETIVYRGDPEHLRYWLQHSLPVIVILADPAGRRCYWQVVREDLVTETERGWKMVIPKTQVLDASARAALAELAAGPPHLLRLHRLQADRSLIELLAAGKRLVLEVQEWINKSSGRGDFKILLSKNWDDEEVLAEWTWLLPGWDYADALPRLFPWADLSLDEDTYDSHDEDAWTEACGIWDSEDKCYIMHTKSFEEWRERLPAGLRPYQEGGEVAAWRLDLTLNELGRAFLVVDQHLADEDGK